MCWLLTSMRDHIWSILDGAKPMVSIERNSFLSIWWLWWCSIKHQANSRKEMEILKKRENPSFIPDMGYAWWWYIKVHWGKPIITKHPLQLGSWGNLNCRTKRKMQNLVAEFVCFKLHKLWLNRWAKSIVPGVFSVGWVLFRVLKS